MAINMKSPSKLEIFHVHDIVYVNQRPNGAFVDFLYNVIRYFIIPVGIFAYLLVIYYLDVMYIGISSIIFGVLFIVCSLYLIFFRKRLRGIDVPLCIKFSDNALSLHYPERIDCATGKTTFRETLIVMYSDIIDLCVEKDRTICISSSCISREAYKLSKDKTPIMISYYEDTFEGDLFILNSKLNYWPTMEDIVLKLARKTGILPARSDS